MNLPSCVKISSGFQDDVRREVWGSGPKVMLFEGEARSIDCAQEEMDEDEEGVD